MRRTHRDVGTRLLILMAAAAALGGCKTRPLPGTVVYRQNKQQTQTAAAPASLPASAPTNPLKSRISDERYLNFVRPLLREHRCDAGNCHGHINFLGGFYLATSVDEGFHDYKVILGRIDRKHPEKSQLLQKALGQVAHNGGTNLDEKSCAVQRLVAWIGERPEPGCKDPPPPDLKERFARELAPALSSMGCAEQSCHGGETKARARMDLSELHAKQPRMELPLYSFNLTAQNHLAVYHSAVVRAANAEDGIHTKNIDKLSCGYRRLYGFVARSPELSCDLADDARGVHQPGLPSMQGFAEQVVPVLQRRGCTEMTCHGNAAGDMPLFGNLETPQVPLHDYLMLTARIEDFAHVERSTLLRTPRNIKPHGGGQRLGGKGDCLDGIIVTWASGKVPKECPPSPPPSYERYATQVQAVFDHMTCSNKKCHGGNSIPHFPMRQHAKTPEDLRFNYESVLHMIDLDFMPFSQVQLRMREPCAYAIVGAWIENKPKPTCVMGPPDPNAFPRRDVEGNVMPPKAEPGPTPPAPAPPPTTTKT